MKAGILTMYGNVNYGNKLQNYAVAKLLEMRGISTETLIPRSQVGIVNIAWRVIRRTQEKRLRGIERKRFDGFAQFTKNTPPRYLLTARAKRRAACEYDFLVLGSDQIWHPRAFNLREERFGSFFPPDRVLCVAPSFGVSELPDDCLDYYRDGLSRLKWLSVREEAGAALIRKLTGRSVPVLADPTIGLPVEEWNNVKSEKRCPKSSYVLLYMLGALSDQNAEALKTFSHNGIEVVNILNKEDSHYYCASPDEFIGLISNASCVFTDSFHASVFSMLFDTPVNILRREGAANNVFSRLETFSRAYGLKDRVIESIKIDNWNKYMSCDYRESWKVAESKRAELNSFIDAFIQSIS